MTYLVAYVVFEAFYLIYYSIPFALLAGLGLAMLAVVPVPAPAVRLVAGAGGLLWLLVAALGSYRSNWLPMPTESVT